MIMDDGEIIREYSGAKNKKDMIQILADQNCVSRKEMAAWLLDHGQEVDKRFINKIAKPATEPEGSDVLELADDDDILAIPAKPYDIIKNPQHYCAGRKYEPRKVIHDWGLNFNLGSVVKYVSRAGRKDEILMDLYKAKMFLEFEIEELEAGAGK